MAKERKFCFVLPVFSTGSKDIKGGSEIQVHLIAQELLKRGWEVHYIRENNQKVSQVEKIEGIVVHSLHERHTKLKWLNTIHLYRLMKKIQADIWYCRATVSYIFPVWINAKRIGGKVLWSCSSDRFLTKKPIKELIKESFLRKVASFIDRFLFLTSIKKIDLIILQSYDQKKMLEENWRLKGEVIHNSHPLNTIKKAEREPLILWIGRLTFRKHPEKFIELAEKLKERPYKFLAMGREAEELGFAQKLMKTKEEIKNFKYLGEIEREEVLHWLGKAKLVVNTSDYEGFSNTFIEAWLHGVPVVSLKVDPDDSIQKNRIGCVSSSMEQLVKDVEELMEHPELWRTLSKRCQKFAEKNFNIVDKVSLLEELIRCSN